jgi:hypothetical protein
MLGNWFGAGVAKLALGKRPLQFVLVWALVFGLVVGAAMPNGAQTPTPTVDDEIVRQAKEDAEMGTAQKRKEFRDAFAKDANQKSRSSEELDKLYTKYVEAYNKAKDAKEVDPKEAAKGPLQSPAPWIISTFVLAIIALFKDWIASLSKQISTAINTWIYQRFSGTKLFWNIALKKYRKALVRKNEKLKIPFRDAPLKMADVYVPLKVAQKDRSIETIEGEGTEAELLAARQTRREAAIDPLNIVSKHRRLMVTGEPGAGKTMLLRYLALNYGNGILRLDNDPIVILLELHRLSGGADILSQLVKALTLSDFPNSQNFLLQALKKGTCGAAA